MISTQKRQYDGIMRILNLDGDRRIVWRKNSIPEIRDAKKVFRDALAEGHLAFKAERGGRGEKIVEFDPAAEEIILVPPIVGG